jgi:hypothetical protein
MQFGTLVPAIAAATAVVAQTTCSAPEDRFGVLSAGPTDLSPGRVRSIPIALP